MEIESRVRYSAREEQTIGRTCFSNLLLLLGVVVVDRSMGECHSSDRLTELSLGH